jgi:2-oxoglutarate ferredoxin oxidoreductase subunit alpha
MAIEAFRIAVRYMIPVVYLSDGYLANGSEPWRIPGPEELPSMRVKFHRDRDMPLPYVRDPQTLSRPWIVPGTPGLEHRIGGLEKQDGTGDVSYNSRNHEIMVGYRAEKVRRIAEVIPPLTVSGPETGDLLILGWGSTYGAIRHAAENARNQGLSVASAHLKYLNPWPANTGEVLGRYKHVLLPELNSGQLRMLLRAEYLVDIIGMNKIMGKPFLMTEIEEKIQTILGGVRPLKTAAVTC